MTAWYNAIKRCFCKTTFLEDAMREMLKKYSAIIRTSLLSLAATLMSIVTVVAMRGYTLFTIKEFNVVFDTYIQALFLQLFIFALNIVPVILIYYYFDNVDLFSKREYFERRDRASLLKSPPYIIGFSISMLASTVIFSDSFFVLLYFLSGCTDRVWSDLLSVALMLLVRFVQLSNLKSKWDTELDYPIFAENAMFKRNRDMYKFKPHQLILQPIGYCIVFYLVASVAITYSIPIMLAVLNILLTAEMWFTIVPAIIAIIAAIMAARFLWNLRPRRMLLKYLRSLEKRGLATVRYSGSKYLSSAFASLKFSFELVTSSGDKYNCIVVTGAKINAPIFFKRDQYLVERGAHMRGGLMVRGGAFAQAVSMNEIVGNKENPTNHIFGFKVAYDFDFPESDGKKTIIVNPASSAIFALSETSTLAKPIDTGEILFDYTVYNATGFHNHIERSCYHDKFET